MDVTNYMPLPSFNGKNKNGYCNAHLCIKGHSVIIDYEHILHDYDYIEPDKVPVEVLMGSDVLVSYIKLDEHYKKADLNDLMKKLKEIIR